MVLVASRGLLRVARRFYRPGRSPVSGSGGHCASCSGAGRGLLSYGSAIATGAGYVWYIAAVEEVSQPDLFGPQLHEESTIPLF
ncbi:hypothetical protein DM02DRAFT_619994 [Periconia macrospinosa]|uniref:Uncharacterized protein n=1 Tax=Periconia macrospinosa TaxID=97972 RepID=A0A2V1D2U3_9PLEO|nr:hypothetical protein DM02DRAFT_619994 [Periconia macrospinosa]